MVLNTAAGAEAIRDVFIFVEDDCELSIEPVSSRSRAMRRWNARRLPGRRDPTPRGPKRLGGRLEYSRVGRKAGSAGQPGGRTGDRAGAPERGLPPAREDADILEISEAVDRLTAELRENSMSIRMLPLRNTFERFRRLVHDLGIELHKEVELAIEGADTELDKTVIDQLNDPLVHLIRNSMDHGIETPEARRAAGKPPTGDHSSLRPALRRQRADPRSATTGAVWTRSAVRARAIEQGLIDGIGAALGGRDLLADPGARVSPPRARSPTYPGRGVGMDVVRRSVEALRGTIEISSRPGAGADRNAAASADAGHYRRAAGARRRRRISCCRWPTAWNASS